MPLSTIIGEIEELNAEKKENGEAHNFALANKGSS